ncbi:MAG TPA: class I SAM-dependent methyltransferase [Pirellulales bacterium]|nr:class I SAM-dependent methyltransferase [Pirellulales bacterium]
MSLAADDRVSIAAPAYAEWQEAYHRAFAVELKKMLSDVFRLGVGRVLDLACGDGSYAAWLSELFGPSASVIAVDRNLAWLRSAQGKADGCRDDGRIVPLASDALRLPFESDSFDAVWCAQSLYSLRDPGAALAEMHRVVRPGGTVAVLENDTLHEILLPWPPDLELAVRQAELAAFHEEGTERYYVGRSLARYFQATGFKAWSLKTYAISRVGAAESDVQTFLEGYLADLRQRIASRLAKLRLAAFDRYLASDGEDYLLDRTDFTLTSLVYVAWGVK